ncbi:hypothetical protein BGX29_000479 [Mortierella sp. GBA35]|nr:hypothetical protein BGX29_000479 [Mortierella sp. GBA35]
MATPEDSHVLRQLIDQIDGELCAFNTVGGGSDQSLTSFATSQGSLAPSNQNDSRQGSSLSLESQGDQDQRTNHYSTLQQQVRQHVASATSAIFGSSFERPIQQNQHPVPPTTTVYGSTSLIMNGSYYMGPRAPQYIPSPLTSPISPGLTTALPGLDRDGLETLDSAERSRQSTLSQGLVLAVVSDITQDQFQHKRPSHTTSTTDLADGQEDVSMPMVEAAADDQVVPTGQEFDDQIKVDVTELYEKFGQTAPLPSKHQETLGSVGGIAKIDTHIPDSPLILKLPELSFSSNDLGSLLSEGDVDKGISASSTSSSIASSSGKSTAIGQTAGEDLDAQGPDGQDPCRRSTTKSQQSHRNVQSQSSEGGVFGTVPGRGQLMDVPPEKLVFPDLSLKPIPLKAYRVRKMTLQERNFTYAAACEEFTRARSGLDVWALRCMMQDRPALMKDPPAIVRAIVGKQVQGPGESKLISNGRMTPTTTSHVSSPLTSSISSGHGLSARIKNAGKRLSMDISGGMATTPEPQHPSGTGSLFYKQKSAKSAVELGSWSPGLARGLSNLSATSVNSGIPPPPQGANNRRNSSSASLQPRTGLVASPSSGGSTFLSHQKRNSIAAAAATSQGTPLFNSLRGRTMSDVQAGSRLSMVGKDPAANRTINTNGSGPQQQQGPDLASSSPLPYRSGGPLALISPTSTSSSPIATSSAFIERPVKRSLSSHYTRRPASMMIVPNPGQTQNQISGAGSVLRSTSNRSLGSLSSSSLGFVSSNSVSDSLKGTGNFKSSSTASSSTASSLTMELKHQQQQEDSVAADTSRPEYAYQADGTAIPYADETKSKDEIYSPLTSPIMIPLGGFPVARPSVQTNGHQANGGWTSPLSAGGGGLTRPLTYAGPSSSSLGSNSSLVMSPATVARGQQQSHQQQHRQQQQDKQQSFAQAYLSPTTPDRGLAEPNKEKAEKSFRYSTSSFSSIGSFANQSPSHTNDYLTEQSLDKLSDVLPHVDRDRLSIYLQRAYGDEMVAIGLAMSDLRSGQL